MRPASPYAELVDAPPVPGSAIGSSFKVFDVIDSTNTYALEHGEDGMVIVADRQTSGRGRQGRTWHSAPGLGLWCTIAFDGLLEGLTIAAALAVRDALADRAALTLKWPNDLLLHRRKICGILVEHRAGRTALGIGLNVHHRLEDFPPELQTLATSLEAELGGDWSRVVILKSILTELDRRVMLLRSGQWAAMHRDWADACAIVGRTVRSGAIEGVVARIDTSGALVVETDTGPREIRSGELEILFGD